MHNGEHGQRHQHDNPEVLTRIGRLDDGQQNGGDEPQQLQIGHHVEQSDEHAQADCHGEVDNQEAYAKEHAHTESYQSLASEVFVHAFFNIAHQLYGKAAIAGRHQGRPALCNAFVVEQDEKRIEHNHRGREQSCDGAERPGNYCPDVGHGLLDSVDETLLGDNVLQLAGTHVLSHVVGDESGNAAHRGIVLNVDHQQVLHPQSLFYHGWHDNPERTRQHSSDNNEGTKDARDAILQPTTVLEELNQRKKQIGDEPRHEEWQQHAA